MLNRKIAISAISILASLALMGGATFAYFTDTKTSSDNTFASGTLDIDIVQTGGTSGFIPFNVTGMQPGDMVAKCAGVSNIGTLDFRWHFSLTQISPTVTPNLNDVLTATIQGWSGASAPTEADCAAESQNASWNTALYTGPISAATNPDRMGTLGHGQTAYYRVTVELPTSVTDAYQSGSAGYQFKVDAFQLTDPAY